MSFTLIDYFKGFQSMRQMKRFSAGVQATYYAILAEFNTAHFPANLTLSTRDLKELAGLKSVATAHECRNVLKNNKLIDFDTRHGTTVYKLLTEHIPNASRTQTEQEPNTCRTPQGVLGMRARIDCKTLDVQTNKRTNAGACARAGAGVKWEAKSAEIGELDDSSSAASLGTGGTVASALASALPLKSSINEEESDDIFKAWNFITNNAPLGGYQKYELKEKAERDYQLTIEAIKKAMDTKSSFVLKFEHFKKTFDELKNPPIKRGGEKVEQSNSNGGREGSPKRYNSPMGREYHKPREFDPATVFDE